MGVHAAALRIPVFKFLNFNPDFRCGLIVAKRSMKVAANDFQISMTISKNGYFTKRLAAEVTHFAITHLTFFVTRSPHRLTIPTPRLAPFLLNRRALTKTG